MLSRRKLIVGAGYLSALGLAAVHAGEPTRIRMASNSHYPPFSFLDDTGRLTGLLIDALALVSHDANILIDFVDMPWARGQQMVRGSQLDGFCTIETAERRRYAEFAPTWLFAENRVVLHRSGDPRLTDPIMREDLLRLKIGEPLGTGGNGDILPGSNFEPVPDIANLLPMIASGRLDVAIVGEQEIKPALALFAGTDILQVSALPDIPQAHYCFGLRKSFPQCPALVARMDRAIKTAQRSGALQSLVDRYG